MCRASVDVAQVGARRVALPSVAQETSRKARMNFLLLNRLRFEQEETEVTEETEKCFFIRVDCFRLLFCMRDRSKRRKPGRFPSVTSVISCSILSFLKSIGVNRRKQIPYVRSTSEYPFR